MRRTDLHFLPLGGTGEIGMNLNAWRFGGIEVGDLVAPALPADLSERRLEAAGDELFVEAWGAGKPIMNYEL